MLKLFNQRCVALQPLKTRLISGFLRRSGFAAHFSTAAAGAYLKTNYPLCPEYCLAALEPKYPYQLVPSSDISLSSLFGTGGYLVRNNGDRVDLKADTFKGKYVFVCCFHVPPALSCWFIAKVCDRLLHCARDDIEVVMAASVVVDGDDGKQVFDHFFSAFPKPCLAVPFEDSKRRAHVCKLVADYTCSELNRHMPCLCLDNTEGMVLPLCKSSPRGDLIVDLMKAIKARDEPVVKKSISSLEQLLLIKASSPDAVYKLNPEGGPREQVRILELKDKLVGLYVPGRSCDLFPTLVHIYEQCMEKHLEFEIVVANRYKVDRLLLQKHNVCRQWWWLPYSKSVSAQLDRLIKAYRRPQSTSDKLCVVGPAGGFIDMHAPGKVMETYGVDGYPFTRETIIQKEVAKMRESTLESVLLGGDIFRGTDRDDVTCAGKLLGRKVNVYFGCLHYMWDHDKVLSSYLEMKAKDPGFEVVFVYLKNDMDSVELLNKTIYSMPWYVCSFDLERLESVREKLGMNFLRRGCLDFGLGVVGFGEDGRVRSCQPADVATFTLDDTLYEDVSKRDLPCDQEVLE